MLNRSHIDTVVRAALDEDAPWGDLTSTTLIPAEAAATAAGGIAPPGTIVHVRRWADIDNS